MACSALSPGPVARFSLLIFPRLGVLVVLAGLSGAASVMASGEFLSRILLVLSLTLICLSGAVALVVFWKRRGQAAARAVIGDFVALDAAPCVATGPDGEVWYLNEAAINRFDVGISTFAGMLRGIFANPGAILFRLQGRAEKLGAAREDVVTRRGHVRLAVHRIGHDGFLWRMEEMGDRPQGRSGSDDGAGLPLFTVGRNGTVLFMNEAARRLSGERVKTLDRIFPSLPVRPGKMNMVSTANGPVSCLVAELDATGGRREIYLLPGTDPGGEPQDNRGDFDDLPVPLLKISPQGKILFSNRHSRDLLGGGDCDHRPLADLVQGLGRSVSDWLAEAASGRGSNHSEFLRLTRRDKEVFVQVTLKRVDDTEGSALIAVLSDATELKTLEAQFVQSQKMQAIGQLAGGVAHDFNNLLTAISGHCDLLLLRHDPGDGDYGDLMQINQNANRAAALVGQLLAFSRKQTLQPEVLDLRDTLSDLTHLLNRLVGEKVTLTLIHDPVLKSIRADKRQLEQVVMNLVVNARDAMPGGGEIRIETENLHLSEPLARDRAVVAPGYYVVVKVTDQGTGIATDKLQKIFEPFYTTKRTGEGTGLGLSTAYGIVKQTGGFIFVDSAQGSGTVFTLLFPVNETPMPAVPKQPVGEAEPLETLDGLEGVVLLVEDEAPVRAFASRALKMRGFTVLEAENAEEALEKLEDDELTVDLFVTDVVMPGLDGPSWVRKALEKRPGVRVVFVSGYAEDAFGDGQPQIPNSTFLPKPFSLAQLTETVRQQMH